MADFAEVFNHIKTGGKAKREKWNDVYICLVKAIPVPPVYNPDIKQIQFEDHIAVFFEGTPSAWEMDQSTIMATDWVLLG